MAPRNTGPNRTLDILNTIAEQGFAGADVVQNLREQGVRVERIAIGLIRPDAAQPRCVLPEAIHQSFHNQEITPLQALKAYIEKVRIISRQKGRPFENLLDLVMMGEEQDDTYPFTPQENDLRELTNLALTLRQDGQVNPLTVVDHSQGAMLTYIIETGERRYWANYINMEFIPGYSGDGTIPCIILPPGQASVFRQAKENTARAGLNAIGMARQAALLILHVHGIEPPEEGPVSNDFYRQALDLDLRGKREYSGDILAAMGGISRAYFSRIKALIGLSDAALELADRHDIDEARLRYVLNLHPEEQPEMVRQIIDYGLTRKQVEEICTQSLTEQASDIEGEQPKEVRQTIKLLRSMSKASPYDIARGLFEQEGDTFTARAYVQRLKKLLEDVEAYLVNE